MEYEDVLHGQKAKVKNVTDKSGKVLSTEVVSDGQRGKDLVLTIDMDLQNQVEKIIEEELSKGKDCSKCRSFGSCICGVDEPSYWGNFNNGR